MLEIKDVNVFYGAIHAIKGITLNVGDGELVSLIGANGAGKTTALHTISGLLHATSGEILLDGKNLQKVPANSIIGMENHTSENRRRLGFIVLIGIVSLVSDDPWLETRISFRAWARETCS